MGYSPEQQIMVEIVKDPVAAYEWLNVAIGVVGAFVGLATIILAWRRFKRDKKK